MRLLFMLLAGVLLGSPAAAAEQFAVMGPGAGTCTEFNKFRRLDARRAEDFFFNWTQGYLSGWNSAQIDAKRPYRDLKSVSVDEQQAFLRRFCDKNPDSPYLEGVLLLQYEFRSVQSGVD
jgi:hypothetical protein